MRKLFIALGLLAINILSNGQENLSPDLSNLDSFIDSVRSEWSVPGMSVAVIKDGQILYKNGFGVKDLESNEKVTTSTLFGIGSSTKAFTSTALGVLVDQQKLDWNTPVHHYIPGFKLANENTSMKASITDFLCHRSGMPRHPFNREIQPGSIDEYIKRIQYLAMDADPGTKWQYSNINYIVGTHLLQSISGQPWVNFMQENIFNPLIMKRTYCTMPEAVKDGDIATPYVEMDSTIESFPFHHDPILSGAGTIVSNVEDLSNWVTMNLHQGRFNDSQVISPQNLMKIQMPHEVIQRPLRYPEIHYENYGLGWFVANYRGNLHVHHGGVYNGYTALVSFLPMQNVGVVILANLNGTQATTVIERRIYDELLGLEPVDWNSRMLDARKRMMAYLQSLGGNPQKVEGTKPSHEREEYLGKYSNPAYGIVSIEKTDEEFTIHFEGSECKMRHYHYDVYEFVDEILGMGGLLTFNTNPENGKIDGFRFFMELSGGEEIVFDKL